MRQGQKNIGQEQVAQQRAGRGAGEVRPSVEVPARVIPEAADQHQQQAPLAAPPEGSGTVLPQAIPLHHEPQSHPYREEKLRHDGVRVTAPGVVVVQQGGHGIIPAKEIDEEHSGDGLTRNWSSEARRGVAGLMKWHGKVKEAADGKTPAVLPLETPGAMPHSLAPRIRGSSRDSFPAPTQSPTMLAKDCCRQAAEAGPEQAN